MSEQAWRHRLTKHLEAGKYSLLKPKYLLVLRQELDVSNARLRWHDWQS